MTITTATSTSTSQATTAGPSMATNTTPGVGVGVGSNGANNINDGIGATAESSFEPAVQERAVVVVDSSSHLNNTITNDSMIESDIGRSSSPPIPSAPKKDVPVPISLVRSEVKNSIDEVTPFSNNNQLSKSSEINGDATTNNSTVSSKESSSTIVEVNNTSNDSSDNAPPPVKKLKGLLKKPSPDKSKNRNDKNRKRVTFSETMMVFCDDWPMEYMPQIMAMKSPSDFNLVEVAASGYMFEPPIEYQDCLPFDPPPDYRDVIAQVTRANDDEQLLQHSYVTHNESMVNTANVTTTASTVTSGATLKSATSTSATSTIVIPATDDVSNGFAFIDSGKFW